MTGLSARTRIRQGSGVLGLADWLVGVQACPQAAQEHLGTTVHVLDVFRQFTARDLVRDPDGLAELGFEGPHLLVVSAFPEPLQ
jgi:hypothetical protein